MSNQSNNKPRRQYPPIYEKALPIVLGIIVIAILILLIVIFVVALGATPTAG